MTDGWPTALRTALRRGQLLVAEVPAVLPDHRAWIAVYPVRRPAAHRDEQVFTIFHREFDNSYLDSDRCIGPDDGMTDVRIAQAADENALNDVLIGWGIDPGQLSYVHRTDYPV
ncbi:hypothetical protein [Micromonospora sp. 4G55]|uniref:hypothetical protein n=1 Tax=Micromonospora sp. 4G55 TaxID=2806102 RepID=UPI001A566DBF|nr:hypothetical protein [Micromonospora sp. 4G55]MBM0256036.1 hypothetical protein [Micromonospora sp. 4G55]